ncbi:PadR family transcriptional regulator [Thermomonospora amylolytica]|uniref:PadR family transcriptional regulator n=1 Tax=Thermomonospora amylolytica TaxID=1411117 RepID=UPI000E6D3814|nr:PadR family transcriptional regulator [Thermomonospora amylolytica]
MAKRRKVGNLLALAVLATVVQRPMHPYEIASLLRARGKGDDMEIKWGSLYTVVRNLAKHGFLEVAGSAREGARPERTVYRITDAGRAELVDWVRELISTPQPERPKFKAGLSVLMALSPDEAAGLLRHRLDALERANAAARESLAEQAREIPRAFLLETEYEIALREAETAWVRSLLEELTSGTFPGLDLWRQWHRTRQVPQELAELAERGGAD